ncbi:hypothetical protein HYPSUDRAFT_31464 [Hypholoma sublateritium FD-334 SS-4]|uniref:DUF6593 domain-containing protein n=1 Tax=Hypholoma sublateritium (strain FD-334 SS-4) TaxID=945553 RepID=A0A0D2LN92_HYPSF|nr:hypothetical protein HYPSUDRAFT_31464 [Hypholoma sublateritium FD-334 SS-4]
MECTLIQWGDDPLRHHYIDAAGRMACTVKEVDRNPNPIIRVGRETAWAQLHPNVLGPDNAYLYLGPESTAGFVIYGNNPVNLPMHYFLRPGKQPNSISRYFRCQNGRDYKWKVSSHKMECYDGRTLLATWEVSPPREEYFARLVVRERGMSIITEILTSLIINRMSMALGW